MAMKLSAFNFEIPEELTAQYPHEPRDESRLLVAHKDTGKIEHKIFKDILEYFDEGDVAVYLMTPKFFLQDYLERRKKPEQKSRFFFFAN
ncbi:S-adenosylmethionine:tRNA ribosyltransferase-isomerase [Okeania hirsuta]|uniref:S-adenosylmethionine:tRNA ribosyltransferase-isomerase n=1 Tax=Okeania hirsuta TaxID=1458930 RepID=UPI00249E1FDB|nr:S-adenosylmethionine:tRNA ribosyltransferase-isomerase [Okeania hirsuta]